MIIILTFSLGESILLQEFFLDQFSGQKGDLLIGGESFLTYELHQILKGVLILQDLLQIILESVEVGIDGLIEIGFEEGLVRGIGNVPVDRGEMLLLGQFLFKP